MSDQVRAWERPEGEMAFECYRLPALIGQGGMGKVIAAAAAAIALAPFSVLAATPGVAQAEVVAAYAEPIPNAPPWWHAALHYGVLVIAVCFVAWLIHRSKLWSAPMTASALWPPRRGFGR